MPTLGSRLDSDYILTADTAVAPAVAFANVSASQTDSSIVSGVTGKKLRVLAVALLAGGTATNITFNTKPSGSGTAISMQFQNGANGGAVLPFNPVGWFQTSSGDGLTVTTGSGATTGVHVVYMQV